jgi:hypothetical protein
VSLILLSCAASVIIVVSSPEKEQKAPFDALRQRSNSINGTGNVYLVLYTHRVATILYGGTVATSARRLQHQISTYGSFGRLQFGTGRDYTLQFSIAKTLGEDFLIDSHAGGQPLYSKDLNLKSGQIFDGSVGIQGRTTLGIGPALVH